MTFEIKHVKQFKRNLKRFLHNKKVLADLADVIRLLANDEPLPNSYRDHPLVGNWVGYRECHVRGDLILIYKSNNQDNVLYLVAFGSHAEILQM